MMNPMRESGQRAVRARAVKIDPLMLMPYLHLYQPLIVVEQRASQTMLSL
jgi:hypothetical protein